MADKDVSPNLLKKIQKSYESSLNSSKEASNLLKKITMGTATYSDADKYAEAVGKALSDAFAKNLSSDVLPDGKMYWHIAESVVEPMYKEAFNNAHDAAHNVQTSINTRHGINLKSRDPKYHKGQAESVMGALCQADQYDDAAYVLLEASEAYALSVVDEALKNNVDFQGQNGYKAKVTRRAGSNCCTWCADLEGEYEYPNVPDGVYGRHDYCKCAVDYDPGTHDGQVQDVWSKEWIEKNDAQVLEDRKTYGKQRTWVKNEAGKYRKQRR